jgi:hypothetical protein
MRRAKEAGLRREDTGGVSRMYDTPLEMRRAKEAGLRREDTGGVSRMYDTPLEMRRAKEAGLRREERFLIDTLVERLRSRMPSAGESVASGNRMSRMEAEEARAMGLKKGGLAVMPKKGKR